MNAVQTIEFSVSRFNCGFTQYSFLIFSFITNQLRLLHILFFFWPSVGISDGMHCTWKFHVLSFCIHHMKNYIINNSGKLYISISFKYFFGP
jgi:hypothetical protein